MNRNNQNSLTLFQLLRQLDAQNPRNGVLAGLGIRTSADVFEAIQKEHEEARDRRQFAREWNGRQGSVASRAVGALKGVRHRQALLWSRPVGGPMEREKVLTPRVSSRQSAPKQWFLEK